VNIHQETPKNGKTASKKWQKTSEKTGKCRLPGKILKKVVLALLPPL
jgi:hypothetical protein